MSREIWGVPADRSGRLIWYALVLYVAVVACASGKGSSEPDVAAATGSGYNVNQRPLQEVELVMRYAAVVRERIEAAWVKPAYSGRRALTVGLQIAMDRTGRLTAVNVVDPSGYAALDRSAIEAVKSADPYPPIPEGVEVDPLSLKLELVLAVD